jgi:hypothetical protein
MKRFGALGVFLTLAAVAVASAVLPAKGEWVDREIKWRLSGVTGDGGSIYERDTMWLMAGGGSNQLDTTGYFSFREAVPMTRGQVALSAPGVLGGPGVWGTAYNSDTTVIGYLVIAADSAAGVPVRTLTSLTVMIEGRPGAYGSNVTNARGWVKADSIVCDGRAGMNLTLADEAVSIPIKTIGAYGNINKWAQLRARIAAGTGTLGSARAFIRYWKPNLAESVSR